MNDAGQLLMFMSLLLAISEPVEGEFPVDLFPTASGDLVITFVGHGSLIFSFGGRIIHVDPYSKVADYTRLPKADLIVITHEHRDHLDPAAIEKIRTERTKVILTEIGAKQLGSGLTMKNGDIMAIDGLTIEAIPAYNLVHRRESGDPFHPRGNGNGYIITFGEKRVYVAGDTENIPEMRLLRAIDIAFLPMNLPYTMTPEMAADAAALFHPRILYPYHTGETDVTRLAALLRDQKETEVRIRDMK
jgi:L-ascorbate metabolism protein UlaG (beta-lactamase superfamily)